MKTSSIVGCINKSKANRLKEVIILFYSLDYIWSTAFSFVPPPSSISLNDIHKLETPQWWAAKMVSAGQLTLHAEVEGPGPVPLREEMASGGKTAGYWQEDQVTH